MNAITILVDSVMWECVHNNRCEISPTPFLDSLRKESITATKMYSHGPYTDAATRSLYTGRRCLDDFGYFFKLNTSPTNHYKVFHDHGYETYGLYYPYYMVGKEMKQYIDHSYYTAGFIFGSEWGGCFYYYSDIIKKRALKKYELILLKERVKMMLDVWLDFYCDIIESPETVGMIADAISKFNVRNAMETLINEKKKFLANPEGYILDFLTQGKKHILASLDGIDIDSQIDREFLKDEVFCKYDTFFSDAQKSNFKANWWKNKPSLRRIVSSLVKYAKSGDKNDIMLIANYILCLRAIHRIKMQSLSHWQDLPSAKTQLDFAADILKYRKNSSKPFYMSLHFLEPHNYVSFFSFDTMDIKIIEEEFAVLEKYCRQLGTGYIGNLAYILSIRYTDYCIEQFCKKLKDLGLWDNTVLTVLSDHGSSYSYYPLHGRHVNCFDDECYHVPMLIRVPRGDSIEISKYCNSMDVLPTLYDVMGFKKQKDVIGESLLDNNRVFNDFVLTEYMGPGCPDLLSRPIWFSIRDSRFLIGYKVGIYQNFEEGDLCEVYDLTKDPMGFYNISKNIDKSKIEYLLTNVNHRFEEIKSDSNKFISHFINKSC